MTQQAQIDAPQKTVLIIGNLTQEGVTTKIKSLGYRYFQKILVNSSANNWISIVQLIADLREEGSLVAVFIHLTEWTILQCTQQEYYHVWIEIQNELAKCKCLVFVYEDNLAGSFSETSLESSLLQFFAEHIVSEASSPEEIGNLVINQRRWLETNMERAQDNASMLLSKILEADIEIVPYKKRMQITVRIQEFLDEIETGVILRLYIPNKRYQADQLESFIRLLENYLRTVEQRAFSVDVHKADHGLVYIFRSQDGVQVEDLNSLVERFESFMALCQGDFENARAVLSRTNMQPMEAEHLISKYMREYRRLTLDIRHEYEQKTLALKQRLESEILDEVVGATSVLPLPATPSSLLSLPQNFGTISINVTSPSIENNQFVQSVIAQTLNGDVTYDAEDGQLLELFNKYATRIESIQFKSSLDEMKDGSTPQEKRQTAKQKISGFLYKIAPIIGQSVVKGLADYLEKKVSGSP